MRGKLLTSSTPLNSVHVKRIGPMNIMKLYFLRIFDNPLKNILFTKSFLLGLSVLGYLLESNRGLELVSSACFLHNFSVKNFPM